MSTAAITQFEIDLRDVLKDINSLPYEHKHDDKLFVFAARKALTKIDILIAYQTGRGEELETNVILGESFAENIRNKVWNS